MKIKHILDKIDEKQLFIPAFQREYVWKRNDAKNLMMSLVQEYPTGTMLTWETMHPPELKGDWDYDEKQGAVKLILDGQQRITTLYMLIRGEYPPYYTKAEILNDTRNLYMHLETKEFQYYKQKFMENNPLWINITDVFQGKIKGYQLGSRFSDEIYQEKMDIIGENFNSLQQVPEIDFLEQQVPVKASLKEAIDIFYIVNASGVNLTDAELALAQISGYWPKAREKFKAKLAVLKENGFDFKLDFIIYALLGVLYHQGKSMKKLHGRENLDKIKEAWKLLDDNVIDHVLNILQFHAHVNHSKEINSVYALIPIIVYTYKKHTNKESFTEEEIKKIVKWYYYSQIRQRYISQLPQKLDKDNYIAATSEQPFDELLNIIKAERSLEITPDEFVGTDIRNALYSLMTCYFKSRGAVCFNTGVGIEQNMGKKYSLEWDHIFPYSLLKKNGYNRKNKIKYSLAQEITNRAIITQLANRTKTNKEAYDYLKEVKNNYPKALELQLIPMDEELWKMENYEKFLQKRRELLAKHLNEYLNSFSDTKDYIGEAGIDQLINEGESLELELKASYQWNDDKQKQDDEYEYAVFRTIAAFANTKGGTLILGVNDESDVKGLAQDISYIEGDIDEFNEYLHKRLNTVFGEEFLKHNLKIEYIEFKEEVICKIDIIGSKVPIFLPHIFDKLKTTFYVRTGSSSSEISGNEMDQYILENF
jgi:uncharacterized protein with ParB-like and HNH nuclease domain